MERKLFCEIHPWTYRMSLYKERLFRHMSQVMTLHKYSKSKELIPLEYRLYKHRSLILRKLGNSDMTLQHNKKHTLEKVAPKLNLVVIRPGEVFSFWKLVGLCSKRKGFLEGVTISNGKVTPGTAGGLCQMSNLIHWMVLHSPLTITEHHHHNRFDMFPDYNRQIPFGTGTSIMYNYLDYQFKNESKQTYQLLIEVKGDHLVGELRSDKAESRSYHIIEKDHEFKKENDHYYRCNEIFRKVIDKETGNCLEESLLLRNKSLVIYDHKNIASQIS